MTERDLLDHVLQRALDPVKDKLKSAIEGKFISFQKLVYIFELLPSYYESLKDDYVKRDHTEREKELMMRFLDGKIHHCKSIVDLARDGFTGLDLTIPITGALKYEKEQMKKSRQINQKIRKGY